MARPPPTIPPPAIADAHRQSRSVNVVRLRQHRRRTAVVANCHHERPPRLLILPWTGSSGFIRRVNGLPRREWPRAQNPTSPELVHGIAGGGNDRRTAQVDERPGSRGGMSADANPNIGEATRHAATGPAGAAAAAAAALAPLRCLRYPAAAASRRLGPDGVLLSQES
jgi:hypothetical protein